MRVPKPATPHVSVPQSVRAWRGKPAMQRKLIEAARAAAAGASEAERKRLFLEAASGTTVDRTVEALTETENRRARRINRDRAGAAFEAWRRANPEASETERLNRAVDLALGYGAAPEALKTTVLRHVMQKRGVLRTRHSAMSVADVEATWNIYAALGRLYRRDPTMAKALFPGIHGFVAESVAQGRLGWDAAESDPAARTAILKRVYLDAEKKSFEAHKLGSKLARLKGMKEVSFTMSYRRSNSKRTPASVIEKWAFERGFEFPKDFVDFFVEFGGAVLEEEVGYGFVAEDGRRRDFAFIIGFLHFDPDVTEDSVDFEYRLRCTEHWDQPLLVPFAVTDANTFAVLDVRKSRHAPAVYNADFFDYSDADPNRPNMTWLADSFTEFLDLLEPAEDYDARTGG